MKWLCKALYCSILIQNPLWKQLSGTLTVFLLQSRCHNKCLHLLLQILLKDSNSLHHLHHCCSLFSKLYRPDQHFLFLCRIICTYDSITCLSQFYLSVFVTITIFIWIISCFSACILTGRAPGGCWQSHLLRASVSSPFVYFRESALYGFALTW